MPVLVKAAVDASTRKTLTSLLEEAGVRNSAHVQYSEGCRNGLFHQMAKVLSSPRFDEFLRICEDAFLSEIDEAGVDTIVGYTPVMFEVARHIGKKLGLARERIVGLYDDAPVLALPDRKANAARVAVLADVVLSGKHIESACSVVARVLAAEVSFVGAVVMNRGYDGYLAGNTRYLLTRRPASYIRHCKLCSKGESPAFYDHANGLAYRKGAYRTNETNVVASLSSQYEEWWSWLERGGVLKEHTPLGGYEYDWFVDTWVLLNYEDVQESVSRQLIERLGDVSSTDGWVVLFKSSPNRRGRRVAKMVSRARNVPMVGAVARDGCLYLRDRDRGLLEGRSVLLVDAAVNTGATLGALAGLATGAGAVQTRGCVLINRMPHAEPREYLNAVLGEELVFLFPFPFRAIKTLPGVREKIQKWLWDAESTETLRSSATVDAKRLRVAKEEWAVAVSKKQGIPHGSVDPVELIALLPPQWSHYGLVEDALAELLRNEKTPLGIKCKFMHWLADADAFEWLADDGIRTNGKFLGSSNGEALARVVERAVDREPGLRDRMVPQVDALLHDAQREGTFEVAEPSKLETRLRGLKDFLCP